MILRWKRESFLLLLGDIFFFVASLYLSLFLRYVKFPDFDVFAEHLIPFLFIIAFWVAIYFIAGLYDKQTNALKRKLSSLIAKAQLVNSLVAMAFFYFVPSYIITPKAILFIDLAISIALISFWRLILIDWIYRGRVETLLLVGGNPEMEELRDHINKNPSYKMSVALAKSFDDELLNDAPRRIFTIVTDLRSLSERSAGLGRLPDLIFAKVRFIDFRNFYEDIFNRIPLSCVNESWFLEKVSNQKKFVYDFFKRIMDVTISVCLGTVALPVYLATHWLIKREDGGSSLIFQDRIGQGNMVMRLVKFRSMKVDDGGKWLAAEDDRLTRVGKFIRKTRIDELPQLWNVLKGDISLIGPRPDIAGLGHQLKEQIPYYAMRNLIKSGLSGWAQIHQDKPPQSVAETRERLAYDFYYLKNRSLLLDLEIALKTIKTLLSREGL